MAAPEAAAAEQPWHAWSLRIKGGAVGVVASSYQPKLSKVAFDGENSPACTLRYWVRHTAPFWRHSGVEDVAAEPGGGATSRGVGEPPLSMREGAATGYSRKIVSGSRQILSWFAGGGYRSISENFATRFDSTDDEGRMP